MVSLWIISEQSRCFYLKFEFYDYGPTSKPLGGKGTAYRILA